MSLILWGYRNVILVRKRCRFLPILETLAHRHGLPEFIIGLLLHFFGFFLHGFHTRFQAILIVYFLHVKRRVTNFFCDKFVGAVAFLTTHAVEGVLFVSILCVFKNTGDDWIRNSRVDPGFHWSPRRRGLLIAISAAAPPFVFVYLNMIFLSNIGLGIVI